MAKTKSKDDDVRAYVLVSGRDYPPQRRITNVERGYKGMPPNPPQPLTAQVFRWVAIAKDR